MGKIYFTTHLGKYEYFKIYFDINLETSSVPGVWTVLWRPLEVVQRLTLQRRLPCALDIGWRSCLRLTRSLKTTQTTQTVSRSAALRRTTPAEDTGFILHLTEWHICSDNSWDNPSGNIPLLHPFVGSLNTPEHTNAHSQVLPSFIFGCDVQSGTLIMKF